MTREQATRILDDHSKWVKLYMSQEIGTAIDTLLSNPWHKASEELPKEDGDYLVQHFDEFDRLEFVCGVYSFKHKYFRTHGYVIKDVIYWMPIPVPKSEED